MKSPSQWGPFFAPIVESDIGGECDRSFKAVSEAFVANFQTRGEVGAAVSVYWGGRRVVELWGGLSDPIRGLPWARDTIVCMMSVGKGIAALCALMLADRGQLELSAPVTRYWPAFGQAGKSAITVEQLLAGMAALVFVDGESRGVVMNWEEMVAALERQAPAWPPATRGAYHSATYGHLVGELVRRVDGRPIEVFLANEITGPLGVDYQYGVSPGDMPRVSDLIPNPRSATWTAIGSGEGDLGRAWRILPEEAGFFFNTEAFRSIVFPSANGHGNARAVARIFAALANGGELDGVKLLSPAMIERARTLQWEGECGLTHRRFRYGLGFFLSNPMAYLGPSRRAFGHPGAGGAVGFADPERNLAFSYSPNFMCDGAGCGERCAALVDATYASLSRDKTTVQIAPQH